MSKILGIPNPGIRELREKYLYPLANHGLINYAKSVLNRNENIWFPVDEKTNAFSLFKDKDHRLTILDSALYPTADVIEKYYSSIIKQEGQEGNDNQKSSYRLFDGDGSELSVTQMIDKYLKDPESCFKPSNPTQPSP